MNTIAFKFKRRSQRCNHLALAASKFAQVSNERRGSVYVSIAPEMSRRVHLFLLLLPWYNWLILNEMNFMFYMLFIRMKQVYPFFPSIFPLFRLSLCQMRSVRASFYRIMIMPKTVHFVNLANIPPKRVSFVLGSLSPSFSSSAPSFPVSLARLLLSIYNSWWLRCALL